MNAADLGLQVMDGMMVSLKEMLPNAPEEFWTKLRANIKADELVDMVVPIYAKHLDETHLDAMITFYASPAGQHFIAKQPLIVQESMLAGSKWGETIAQRAIDQLKAEQEPDGD